MEHAIRGLVSKKKIRFTDDGFDLDLTYITPRIIAMGAPSEGSEATYRNPLPEVQRFFESRHKGNYRIYDLRAEKGASYDPAKFGGAVVGYRFFDHNPAPLALVTACCEDMHKWLSASPDHVIAVHCKAGKGRTGLIISAYLVHAGLAPSATAALQLFGDIRTSNGKGVTIPSQMRFVHYYDASRKAVFKPKVYKLRHIRLHTVPNFDIGGGCDPYFDVRLGDGKRQIFNWLDAHAGKVRHYMPKHRIVDLDVSPFNVRIKGDVKLVFYDWDALGEPDKMFHLWINTGFIDNNYLLFHKEVLDRACKDRQHKEFDASFKCEIFLDEVEETPGEFAAVEGPADKAPGVYLDGDNDDDMGGEGDGDDDGDA